MIISLQLLLVFLFSIKLFLRQWKVIFINFDHLILIGNIKDICVIDGSDHHL